MIKHKDGVPDKLIFVCGEDGTLTPEEYEQMEQDAFDTGEATITNDGSYTKDEPAQNDDKEAMSCSGNDSDWNGQPDPPTQEQIEEAQEFGEDWSAVEESNRAEQEDSTDED